MSDTAFEHAGGFEQGKLSGGVRLGKVEAHYEELDRCSRLRKQLGVSS